MNIMGDSAFNMLNFFSRIQDNGFKLQLTLQLDNRRFTQKPYISNMDCLLGFVNIEDIYIFQTGTHQFHYRHRFQFVLISCLYQGIK